MSKFQTLLLFCLVMSCNVFAEGIDISKEYLLTKTQIQNESFNGELLKSYLKNQTVLLIPGVLSQSFSSTASQRIKLNLVLGEIFDDHENWLIEEDVNYEKIELESEASPEENADFIIEVLEDMPDNIIIFTHSKGGIDTFQALSKKPELLEKISGIITVQTPFKGSPIAEDFSNNFLTRQLGNWLFNLLGGSPEGIDSLTQSASKKRNEILEDQYKYIISKVPVINFGSFKEDTFGWDSPLELFRDIADKKSGPNDGVVPLTSAFLDETYQVTEANVDHLLSVTSCKGIRKLGFYPKLKYSERWTYDREAHFKALLESLRKVSY
ncbi:hypothetical protein A9Q84_19845 [Halobacteriovorax marinus]|uniref:Uncharacterized protein n=1 Tax=Halobacteriovorax marinus TaxID=97084 RepID=A0A1Y5F862_9BACT|nr:hypothetical protein A9Q84_19845 [Halobacteriovorax marinus]